MDCKPLSRQYSATSTAFGWVHIYVADVCIYIAILLWLLEFIIMGRSGNVSESCVILFSLLLSQTWRKSVSLRKTKAATGKTFDIVYFQTKPERRNCLLHRFHINFETDRLLLARKTEQSKFRYTPICEFSVRIGLHALIFAAIWTDTNTNNHQYKHRL